MRGLAPVVVACLATVILGWVFRDYDHRAAHVRISENPIASALKRQLKSQELTPTLESFDSVGVTLDATLAPGDRFALIASQKETDPGGGWSVVRRLALPEASDHTLELRFGAGAGPLAVDVKDVSGRPVWWRRVTPGEHVALTLPLGGGRFVFSLSGTGVSPATATLIAGAGGERPLVSLPTIHIRFDSVGMVNWKTLVEAAVASAQRGLYSFPKSNVSATVDRGQGKAGSRVRVGLAGRTAEHFVAPASMHVQVRKGPLVRGMSSFKLYKLATKSGILDLLHSSVLEDEGVMVPHQELVSVFVNGQSLGPMLLLENFGPAAFEHMGVPESQVVGYDPSDFFDNYPRGTLVDRIAYTPAQKPIRFPYPRLSSSAFADELNDSDVARYLAYCIVFQCTHGLGADDLRFYRDVFDGSFRPIVRDLNPGVWGLCEASRGGGRCAGTATALIAHGAQLVVERPPSLWPFLGFRAGGAIPSFPDAVARQDVGLWDPHPALLAFMRSQDTRTLLWRWVRHYAGSAHIIAKLRHRAVSIGRAFGSQLDPVTRTQVGRILHLGPPNLGPALGLLDRELATAGDGTPVDVASRWLDSTARQLSTRFGARLSDLPNQFAAYRAEISGVRMEGVPKPFQGTQARDLTDVLTFLRSGKTQHGHLLTYVVRKATRGYQPGDFKLRFREGTVQGPSHVEMLTAPGHPEGAADYGGLLANRIWPGEQLALVFFAVAGAERERYYTVESSTPAVLDAGENFVPAASPAAAAAMLTAERVFDVSDSVARPRQANQLIDQPVRVPKGVRLELRAGESLRFAPGACLQVEGDISLLGSAAQPVRLLAAVEGKPWGGVHVAGGGSEVEWRHVKVHGYGTFPMTSCGGRLYTGGISFAQARVRMQDSDFSGVGSEDGLHLAGSEFDLSRVWVRGCRSDGVDIDFSRGHLRDVTVEDCQGDGVDISGSWVEQTGGELSGNVDKGLSVGENSTVRVDAVRIRQSTQAIAVKDQSHVTVWGATLEHNRVAISEFIKKPHYMAPAVVVDVETVFRGNGRQRVDRGFFRYTKSETPALP